MLIVIKNLPFLRMGGTHFKKLAKQTDLELLYPNLNLITSVFDKFPLEFVFLVIRASKGC